ncbi:MAG TPA: hypothetical protein VNF47_05210 [Streptosporangiaceae bacterium]|nr:hypothetical protein [Streptosporangiaceae bacterium]
MKPWVKSEITLARNFGGRRVAADVCLRELAAQVHYSRGHLSKVETGHSRASVDLARLCDAVMRAEGALVKLASSGRRVAGTEDPQAVAPALPPARIGQAGVGQAEIALGWFGAQTLRELASATPEPVRPAILTLAARYAEYTGWMAQEAGEDRAVLWRTENAVRLADAAGDRAMGTYALVRRARS